MALDFRSFGTIVSQDCFLTYGNPVEGDPRQSWLKDWTSDQPLRAAIIPASSAAGMGSQVQATLVDPPTVQNRCSLSENGHELTDADNLVWVSFSSDGYPAQYACEMHMQEMAPSGNVDLKTAASKQTATLSTGPSKRHPENNR
jgi:hypothetical protein